MKEKFNNKYRRGSHRFPQWNYAGDGMYYITLVTQGRECHLGKIEKGAMHFSDVGNIVKDQFLQSFEMRTELFLDENVIMPNHIHAIVVLINRDGTGRNDGGGDGLHDDDGCWSHEHDGCGSHDGGGCGLHDDDGCGSHPTAIPARTVPPIPPTIPQIHFIRIKFI